MNIAQLKSAIANLPDDAPVLLPGPDHSYCAVENVQNRAVTFGGYFCEYHSEEYLLDGETVVSALVLS